MELNYPLYTEAAPTYDYYSQYYYPHLYQNYLDHQNPFLEEKGETAQGET